MNTLELSIIRRAIAVLGIELPSIAEVAAAKERLQQKDFDLFVSAFCAFDPTIRRADCARLEAAVLRAGLEGLVRAKMRQRKPTLENLATACVEVLEESRGAGMAHPLT